MAVRMVFFDAFATLIKPRRPIAEQYAEAFKPYFVVPTANIPAAFKIAFKQMQAEGPLYAHPEGDKGWWSRVIERTAIGAGADSEVVQQSMPSILPTLWKQFSSKEGYTLYPDVIPTLTQLSNLGVRTGVVSNADARMRLVLQDLDILNYLDPCVLSDEPEDIKRRIWKPDTRIWSRAIELSRLEGVSLRQIVHVGDELAEDYHGSLNAGLNPFLVRRPGPMGNEERKEAGEDLDGVRVVKGLQENH